MKVYVVLNLELGWDNIVGIFTYPQNEQLLREQFPEDEYHIMEKYVESDLGEYV